MKYKHFPKFVTTLIISDVLFRDNNNKFGIIETELDSLKYVISYEEYSICECIVFEEKEIYDFYVLDFSSQYYKGKLLKEYVNL
ncbi:MAG: hypothetical protein ABFC34_03605 [Methanobacterium sp.]